MGTVEKSLDRIEIRGVTGHGYHGVYDQERDEGQTFVADVVLYLHAHRASNTDELQHTVDYDGVAVMVHDALTGPPVALLETVAEHIAQNCLRYPAVQAAQVSVHKPNAPIRVPFDDIIVTVTRHR